MTETLCESDNTLPKIRIRKRESNTIEYMPNKETIKHIQYKLKNQDLFINTLKRKKKKKKCITIDKFISNASNQKNINLFLKSSNINSVLLDEKNTDSVGFKTCFGNFFTENKTNKLIEPQIKSGKKSVDSTALRKNPSVILNVNSSSSKNNSIIKAISCSNNKISSNRFKEINDITKRLNSQDKSISQLFNLSITPKVNERNKSKLYLIKTGNQNFNSYSNDFPNFIREYGNNLKHNRNYKSIKKTRNYLAMPSLKTKTNNKIINKKESETAKNLNTFNDIEPLDDGKGYLKNIRDKNIKNNICNFLMVLKINMLFEIKIMELMDLKLKKKSSQETIENLYKSILKLLNDYINILNNSFKENGVFFFSDQEYNDFIEQIIQFMICLYSFIFIHLTQMDINESFEILDDDFNQTIKNFSSVLYNYFEKFISDDLDEREYNLCFKQKLIQLFKINKYHIKSNLNKIKTFEILVDNLNKCYSDFTKKIKKMRSVSSPIYSIFESILMLLSQREVNDLQFFIKTITNTVLYCILDRNIQLALNNKKFSQIDYNHLKPMAPFLPKMNSKLKYTLVLDMDETIMYYISNSMKAQNSLNYGYLVEKFTSGFINSYLNEKELERGENSLKDDSESIDENNMVRTGIFLLRPYTKKFLRELKKYYEIVIFTAGTKEYSDKILNLIESNENLIDYRLSRNHLFSNKDGNVYKDLSLLGRDLSKVIIIDDKIDNYSKQKNNGLPINIWTNDINDTSLNDLIPLLKKIVINEVDDVRNIIKKLKNQFKAENYDYSKIKYNI